MALWRQSSDQVDLHIMNVLGKQAKEARALKFKRPRPTLSNASGRKLYGIVDDYGMTAAVAAASPAGSA